MKAFRNLVNCADAEAAIEGICSLGRTHVVTFLGFSDAGYENEPDVRETLTAELRNFDPRESIICAGATTEGIGMVYPLAVRQGFQTAGIVSSVAHSDGTEFSIDCEVIFIVNDETWGGKKSNGRLSSTSKAMVGASDVMIAIGGGEIARDELEQGLKQGKIIRFYHAEMQHSRADEKATKLGESPPAQYGGEAQTLFLNQYKERNA